MSESSTEPIFIHYWKGIISNRELQELLNTWKKDRYWIILIEEKIKRNEKQIYIPDLR